MNTYLIEVKHPSGIIKKFKVQAQDKCLAKINFSKVYSTLEILSVELIAGLIEPPLKKGFSNIKRRSHYKTRLCQIRANLQSMTDDENGLLTEEEVIMIQRIACKVDRVISLFPSRTLDLKLKGVL